MELQGLASGAVVVFSGLIVLAAVEIWHLHTEVAAYKRQVQEMRESLYQSRQSLRNSIDKVDAITKYLGAMLDTNTKTPPLS